MKSTMTAVAVALGLGFASAPALAQAPAAPATAASPTALKTHDPKISRSAGKAILELQKAVTANDPAAIAVALRAAEAAAKTPEDRYAIAMMQLKAAAAAKDHSAIAGALEAMIASGAATQEEKFSLYYNVAGSYLSAQQEAKAAQAYSQALQLNPASTDAIAGLIESNVAQGQSGEAVELLRKGIAMQSAGAAKAPEPWYKRAVAIAYKAKLPAALELSRQWLAAYPGSDAWTNSLAIYHNAATLDETATLDLMRLKHAAGALTGGDYWSYGDIAVRKGFAGEAKAVLEEGFAAKAIERSDASYGELYAVAAEKTKGDRESLPAAPVAGASARQTLNTGDAWFGYRDYAKAADFYRAALNLPEAQPDLINLHLGMALALNGDKAGAAAALGKVGGAEADLARYWLIYANSKA